MKTINLFKKKIIIRKAFEHASAQRLVFFFIIDSEAIIPQLSLVFGNTVNIIINFHSSSFKITKLLNFPKANLTLYN